MKNFNIYFSRYQLLCFIAICTLGCSNSLDDAPETIEVTGTVTFNGEVVSEGSIAFDPVDGKGGSSAGKIIDGKFNFQSQFGEKQVLIFANRSTGKKDQYGGDEVEQYIPKKYNSSTDSELKVTVSQGQENHFDFELEE